VKDCIEVIVKAFKSGNKVLFAVMAGSAADAQHLAAEFSGVFIPTDALPSEALHCNIMLTSRRGNDYSYDVIYSRFERDRQQRRCIGRTSTSGNSKNIVNAFEVAKEKE
jgi:D-sedoheptulose 7-phosphate isomerase